MSPRGGKRPNQTGRPPRAGIPARERVTVWMTEAERAELEAALHDNETAASFLRAQGLEEARRRGGR